MASKDDQNKAIEQPLQPDRSYVPKVKLELQASVRCCPSGNIPMRRLTEHQQKPRNKGDVVLFRKAPTQWAKWKVAAVKLNDKELGDSDRVYQIEMADGNLYNNGEWVAQDRMKNP